MQEEADLRPRREPIVNRMTCERNDSQQNNASSQSNKIKASGAYVQSNETKARKEEGEELTNDPRPANCCSKRKLSQQLRVNWFL